MEVPSSRPIHEREVRQNRRADGVPTGEEADCDECLRSKEFAFSPVTGVFERLSFCRQLSVSQCRISIALFASLRLCVGGRVGGSAFIRVGGWPLWNLCAFV